MKTFLALILALLVTSSAEAAEIDYRFKIVDITLPGQDFVSALLYDINDSGQMIAAADFNDNEEWRVFLSNGRKKHETINCIDVPGQVPWVGTANALSLNNRGQIVGYCVAVQNEPFFYRLSGFFRFRNGDMLFLDAPGASVTVAHAISEDGFKVVGEFYDGTSQHCFLWNRKGRQYTTIDFPLASTSSCYGVNDAGQVLGEYWIWDQDPVFGDITYREHGFFVWENGQFTVPLPLSHDFPGGDYSFHYAYDLNRDGAILGLTDGGIFLWDDGQLFTIPTPPSWYVYELGGMSDSGDFVGRAELDMGGWVEYHSFIATPKRGALARVGIQ